jgi:hypothetical protein
MHGSGLQVRHSPFWLHVTAIMMSGLMRGPPLFERWEWQQVGFAGVACVQCLQGGTARLLVIWVRWRGSALPFYTINTSCIPRMTPAWRQL